MTGGVVSGLGKGITVASLGRLLKARGYKVTIQKFDPYINIDPGTMSPFQHGEVFVTEDGAETDLDLGHYERFIDENLSENSSVTAGKIYWKVLNKERKGEYLGATIQIIPHITNAIKDHVFRAGRDAQSDIVITEIGGTVGDIESLPFLEAIRQVNHDVGGENVMYVHLTFIPYLGFSGEMKTKPTQHSVKELLSLGICPDAICCRTEKPISKEMLDKLAMFCNVSRDCIVQITDAGSIYEVPLLLEEEKFADIVCKRLRLDPPPPDLTEWRELLARKKNINRQIEIGLVGKYVELHDAYLSVVEALQHAGIANGTNVNIRWLQSETLTDENSEEMLNGLAGIIVPGGFGERGINGMISAIRYARINRVPYLGICLGLQCAVIEFARNVLNRPEADSFEYNPETPMPVIKLIPEQYDVTEKGGTMRSGAFPCKLMPGTLAHSAYGKEMIGERHRHRYEINSQYRRMLEESGLVVAGLSPDERRIEIIELLPEHHPWFVGVQFYPEFKSRLTRPSPLYKSFIGACLCRQ
jgi:CTP synthase